MATVKALIDDLVEGRATLADVARDFGTRSWPAMPEADEAAAWGVTDAPVPPAESWAVVQDDPRLTAEQYQMLGAAYRRAVGR
jgi:hypothetical protein